jgi:hypothetical protein
MPQVGVLQLPNMAPPRARIACAYLSWFVPVVGLNHLHEKLKDEPCMRETVRVPVGI